MRGIETDGPKIVTLRAALRLTQEEFARKAQCDVKTLRKAEKGRRVDLATLRRIASALNLPASAIMRPAKPSEAQAERQLDVVRQWQKAINERDIDAMLACYHDDAVLDYPAMDGVPGSGRYCGKEQLRRQAEMALAYFDTPPITPDMYRLHAVDNWVFMRGVAPTIVRETGVRLTASAMHEFEFKGDNILRHYGYFDTLALGGATPSDDGVEE